MRYEIKYAIKNIEPSVVEQAIRLHPAGFRKIHPDRTINNIYFDSPLIDNFYANVAGVSQRRKFRLRWYGKDLEFLDQPVFEVKIKQNQLGQKLRKKLPPLTYNKVLQSKDLYFEDATLRKIMRPTLMNSYLRSYFGLPTGKFRLTVDSQLAFGPVHPEKPQLIYKTIPLVIVELKYKAAADDEVDWIRQYLSFRQTKSSKYALGVSLIN